MNNSIACIDFRILDGVPHGIIVIDREFNILFWNQVMEEWTGVSRSAMTGLSLIEKYTHLKKDVYINTIMSVFDKKTSVEFPFQVYPDFLPITSEDGSQRKLQTTVQCQPYNGEGRSYAIISIMDMTQAANQFLELNRLRIKAMDELESRREMISELKLNEERFTLAQKAAKIGSWDWNIPTGELIWSDTIAPMFGFIEEEFPGTYESFVNSLHPGDRQFVLDSVDKAVNEDVPYKIEHRIIWPDGSVHWMSETGAVLRDDSGKAVRMLGIVMDITQRKKDEEEIGLLTTGIEQTTDSVIITDSNAAILYSNPAFETMTGYSKEELIGQNPRLLNSSRHSKEFFDELWKTIKSGKIWHGEVLNKKRSGELYDEEMTITPVKSSDGKISNYVAIKRDITHRKDLEKKLETLRKEYEGFMRHELRNYLAPVKGYAELLMMTGSDELSDQQRVVLEKINSSTDIIIKLIDDIKKLQDFEHGVYNLNLIQSDINAILNKVVSDFSRDAESFGVRIDFNSSRSVSEMELDIRLLPGVFYNLIKNAIEHVRKLENESEKVVSVRMINENDNIIITINNKGKPLSKERLQLFFEKFNTDRSTKRGGTGLGTTYAYLVTKAHGGDISVESNERDGTTVTLKFNTISEPD